MPVSEQLRVASAQYPINLIAHFADWQAQQAEWVARAAAEKAQLLVFPEYSALDLAGLLPEAQRRTGEALIHALQPHYAGYRETFSKLARQHNVLIMAGSFPVADNGVIYNRGHLFGPQGGVGGQDKIVLTQFERDKTSVRAGSAFKLFETAWGKIAIAICYDIQFPLNIHKLAEGGARLILVPACTGRMPGYHRVRLGCRARALENQLPVVQSSTVGEALWHPLADTNAGAAGCYAPPDHGFPDDGLLAQGIPNQPGWVYADLDFRLFEHVRQAGHVRNWRDWPEQVSAASFPLVTESLS